MAQGAFSHSQIASACSSYGIEADSIDFIAQGGFAEVYRVRSKMGDWVARVRSPDARPEEIRFAASWGQVVVAEFSFFHKGSSGDFYQDERPVLSDVLNACFGRDGFHFFL